MIAELATCPTPSRSTACVSGGDESVWWNAPVNNPNRSALLASASEKLTESAQRIERLQHRLDSLTELFGPSQNA